MNLILNGQAVAEKATILVPSLQSQTLTLQWADNENSIDVFLNGKGNFLNKSDGATMTFNLAQGPNRITYSVYGKKDRINKLKGVEYHFVIQIGVPVAGTASISGTVFNDADADGKLDSNEQGASRVVYIDLDKDGKMAPADPQVTSGPDGKFTFKNLAAGTYRVTRDYPTGYTMSNNGLGYIDVTIADGEQKTGVDLGSRQVKIVVSEPPPAQPDTNDSGSPPAQRRLQNMRLALCGGTDYPIDFILNDLHALNISSLGPWWNVNNFPGKYIRDNDVPVAWDAAKKLGINPMFRFAQETLYAKDCGGAVNYMLSAARDLRKLYDSDPATRDMVMRMQIHNEVDLRVNAVDANGKKYIKAYWPDSPQDYLNKLLLPVGRALRAEFDQAVEIVGCGFSWNTDVMESIADGMAEVCDAFSYHGYPYPFNYNNMARHRTAVQIAKKRGKKIYSSEAGIGNGRRWKQLRDGYTENGKTYAADPAAAAAFLAQWAKDMPQYLLNMEDAGFDESWVFICYDANTTNSGCHLFDVTRDKNKKVNGAVKNQFYDEIVKVAPLHAPSPVKFKKAA